MLTLTPASALTLNFSQEMAMPNTEISKLKKTIERKKHLQVINVLKNSVQVTTITKYILNLWGYLTISKLLVLVPAVRKQLTKTITEDKVMQFQINILESSTVNTENSY